MIDLLPTNLFYTCFKYPVPACFIKNKYKVFFITTCLVNNKSIYLFYRCYVCHNQLIPGDSLVCNDDGSIYCLRDYERLFNKSEEDNRTIGKSSYS